MGHLSCQGFVWLMFLRRGFDCPGVEQYSEAATQMPHNATMISHVHFQRKNIPLYPAPL